MKVTFLGKTLVAHDTYSFSFSPKGKVKYLPGQYFYLTLPQVPLSVGRGPTRQFTLSSSPTETDLVITTTIHPFSEYKKALGELAVGTLIEAEGPQGVLYFDEFSSGNHIFIAGSLGVTPFRSMVKYAKDKRLSLKITLLYGVEHKRESVFLDEFGKWSKNKFFDYKLVLGKRTQNYNINKQFLKEIVADKNQTHYWITGPSKMVQDVEKTLISLQIDPDFVHFEKFTGLP